MDKQTEKELLKIVEKNYESIADSFSQTREKQLWPFIIKLSKTIKPNKKILDVGCGNGRLFELLKDKNVQYTGIDNSQKLIKIAQEKYKNQNRAEFKTANILNLTLLPEINFDYVFAIAVLHHLPGNNLQIQALRQLKNKLQQQGKIIISVWNLWENKKYKKLIFKFWLLKLLGKNKMDFGDIIFDWQDPQVKEYTQRYYHVFTKRQLKRITKSAGLNIEQLIKDKYNYYLILKK